MSMMPESKEFAVCSHCGSSRVRPRRVLAGPILSANRGANLFHCEDCGQDGLLVTFDSEDALAKFREHRRGEIAEKEKLPPRVEAIPIIPLDVRAPLGSPLLESLPFRSAEVVSIRWKEQAIEQTEYAVNFEEYWRAVGSTRYRASTIYVLDIGGINHGEPSFQAMRELAKCDCKILFDLGVSSTEDVMDGFMVDVEKVIASTKSLKTIQDFKDIYALTEDCVPCIDWDDGVLWAGGVKTHNLKEIAATLKGIGYDSLVFMDMKRLGTWSGPSMELAATLPSFGLRIYLGGGIKEEDVPLLLDKGIYAALIDPYTPVIRDIVVPKSSAAKPTAAETPKPAATPDARPSPV
jgi:uncharacterized protein related to proFAR isomerase